MRTGQRQNPGERVAQCSGVAGGEEEIRGTGDKPENQVRWFKDQKELQKAAKSLPREKCATRSGHSGAPSPRWPESV